MMKLIVLVLFFLINVQATAAAPVTGKMFKGLCLCYTVVAMTFFSVSISGYWAFGNQAQGTILSNFIVDGTTLVPKWFLMMTDIFTLLQLSAVTVVSIQHPIHIPNDKSRAHYMYISCHITNYSFIILKKNYL